ncbi:hypothetical protein Sjap_014237 [Stephania japonica]|uniref:DCD domain-containing protein n=1 Tax=Stephania japonica TaxID=461633 RepID=A0AAP0J0R8_9MAGN
MGRKTRSVKVGKVQQRPVTVNASVSARNLTSDKLAAVILGCSHETYDECHSKQIFGLPAFHISYVRNIVPGMLLFLFNYTDRRLHGIYEATSHGQMNINPFGWTTHGSKTTPFPAQVRFGIRMKCRALLEEQFGKIILSNYYTPTRFWFELDQKQTNALVSLFESVQVTTSVVRSVPSNIPFVTCPVPSPTEVPVKGSKWTDLFKPKGDCSKNSEYGDSQHSLEVDFNSNQLHGEECAAPKWSGDSDLKSNSHSTKTSNDGFSQCSSEVDLNSDQVHGVEWPSVDGQKSSPPDVEKLSSADEEKCLSDASAAHSFERVRKSWEDMVYEDDSTHQDQFEMEPTSSDSAGSLDEQKQVFGDLLGKEALDPEKERVFLKLKQLSDDKNYLSSRRNEFVDMVIPSKINGAFLRDERIMNDTFLNDEGFSEKPISEGKNEDTTTVNSSGLDHVLSQLSEEMKELKASSMEQLQKINVLEKKLSDSDTEIQQLKGQVKYMESKLVPSMLSATDLMGKLVFVMGGYDGVSWLSTLNFYSPLRDIIGQLMPMNCTQSYASAVLLDGRIYNLGGGNGNVQGGSWYDTVECYDCFSDKWTTCPSLSQRKGCLASATLFGKIFAVGGGNGVTCFPDVEVFDPIMGKWTFNQPMLQKRLSPAAVDFNGTLYVVGGYDGNSYLSSVEQFDPREGHWSRLPAMKCCRGSHSLAVLNEKIYALGGFDGYKMLSSVEVFDPCSGSWMQGADMKEPKANFAAAVIGEAMYVIGGMKEGNAIADTVDLYREGRGWWATNLKGIGKRCYFSAVVC